MTILFCKLKIKCSKNNTFSVILQYMRTFIYNYSQNYSVQQNFLQNFYNKMDGGKITKNKSKQKFLNNIIVIHAVGPKLSNTYPNK